LYAIYLRAPSLVQRSPIIARSQTPIRGGFLILATCVFFYTLKRFITRQGKESLMLLRYSAIYQP